MILIQRKQIVNDLSFKDGWIVKLMDNKFWFIKNSWFTFRKKIYTYFLHDMRYLNHPDHLRS